MSLTSATLNPSSVPHLRDGVPLNSSLIQPYGHGHRTNTPPSITMRQKKRSAIGHLNVANLILMPRCGHGFVAKPSSNSRQGAQTVNTTTVVKRQSSLVPTVCISSRRVAHG